MFRLMMAAAVSALLLTPAAAFAQKVNTDFDAAADFTKYKTYVWTEGTPSPNPLGEQRVHDALEAQLALEGFKKVAENPDVVVTTHILTKEEKEVVATGYGGGYGYGPRWGGAYGGTTTASVYTYIQGTLVVDMYDAQTKKLVWRGTGTDTASDKADKNAKKVVKALEKMFKQYPPVPKKK